MCLQWTTQQSTAKQSVIFTIGKIVKNWDNPQNQKFQKGKNISAQNPKKLQNSWKLQKCILQRYAFFTKNGRHPSHQSTAFLQQNISCYYSVGANDASEKWPRPSISLLSYSAFSTCGLCVRQGRSSQFGRRHKTTFLSGFRDKILPEI